MNDWDLFLKSNSWSWFALLSSQRNLFTYKYMVILHTKKENDEIEN